MSYPRVGLDRLRSLARTKLMKGQAYDHKQATFVISCSITGLVSCFSLFVLVVFLSRNIAKSGGFFPAEGMVFFELRGGRRVLLTQPING